MGSGPTCTGTISSPFLIVYKDPLSKQGHILGSGRGGHVHLTPDTLIPSPRASGAPLSDLFLHKCFPRAHCARAQGWEGSLPARVVLPRNPQTHSSPRGWTQDGCCRGEAKRSRTRQGGWGWCCARTHRTEGTAVTVPFPRQRMRDSGTCRERAGLGSARRRAGDESQSSPMPQAAGRGKSPFSWSRNMHPTVFTTPF